MLFLTFHSNAAKKKKKLYKKKDNDKSWDLPLQNYMII